MNSFSSDIEQAVAALQNGKSILYPTDTIWGLGCDATDEHAVDRIFEIKKRPKEKSLIILVDSLEMLRTYADIDDNTANLITSFEFPTTVIYPHPRGLASNAVNENDTVAIRIVSHPFCNALLKAFGKPIVSTSANLSGDTTPAHYDDISSAIKHAVDHMVSKKYDTSVYKFPSKLIKFNEDHTVEYLR
jgi:L-threonylcarbamoyladenylate synthase